LPLLMPIGATEHGRHNGYNIDRMTDIPGPATAAMVRCMWRSPSAKTNSATGRRILLRVGWSSKDEMIGNAAATAFISETQMATY